MNRRVCGVAFLEVGRDRVDHALHTGDRSGDAVFVANVGRDWDRAAMCGRIILIGERARAQLR